jgi:DNA polymerase epsilon subunit 2
MPGPADAGCAAALPRPPLPRSLTRALRGAVPGAVFASNPCRLRWHATEVVLFREDIAGRMRRACVRSPAEEGGGDGGAAGGTPGEWLFGAVCATVLQQGHLAPLPLPHAPVFWEWDHALWLYPLPHALLLADRSVPQASCAFEDVAAANPGSFGTDGSFAVFRPAQRTFELSAVPLSA